MIWWFYRRLKEVQARTALGTGEPPACAIRPHVQAARSAATQDHHHLLVSAQPRMTFAPMPRSDELGMSGQGCRDGHRVIAGLADLFANCAAGDFALNDEGVDVVFPAIGLEGDIRAVMNKTG